MIFFGEFQFSDSQHHELKEIQLEIKEAERLF